MAILAAQDARWYLHASPSSMQIGVQHARLTARALAKTVCCRAHAFCWPDVGLVNSKHLKDRRGSTQQGDTCQPIACTWLCAAELQQQRHGHALLWQLVLVCQRWPLHNQALQCRLRFLEQACCQAAPIVRSPSAEIMVGSHAENLSTAAAAADADADADEGLADEGLAAGRHSALCQPWLQHR